MRLDRRSTITRTPHGGPLTGSATRTEASVIDAGTVECAPRGPDAAAPPNGWKGTSAAAADPQAPARSAPSAAGRLIRASRRRLRIGLLVEARRRRVASR